MPPALQNPFALWFVLTAAIAGAAYLGIRKELRVRATLYGSFLAACLVLIWPPFQRGDVPGKIHLGLDLQGGIHLILQVVTDDALEATVDDAVHTARDQMSRKGIVFGDVQRLTPTAFAVEGIEPARVAEVRDDILEDYFRDWQVRATGEGGFRVEMSDPLVHTTQRRTVEEAMRTLERRVNQLGVSEPVIAEHGSSGDQILVQLPGVSDPEAAKRVISTTAQLALKIVEDSAPSREALLEAFEGRVPDKMELVDGAGEQPGQRVYYLVRREAVITGRDLKNARVGVDPQTNSPEVEFSLLPQGTARFKRETGRNIGRQLAIILDDNVESAPVIQSQIGAEGRISGGRMGAQEADELSKLLRAGALPATLKYLQELSVGASLGQDSVRSGVIASLAGMSFIALFMLFYYRLSGINAVVALAVNLLVLLAAMAYMGATLTLPGIAGIILTVGVGVDTNVLVFERIREELRSGRTVKAAISNGFERVWFIILDTHITGLIAAALLFQFGTGPIKGFAVTLFIGLVANVFASFFVSRFLFEWILGKRQVATLSI
jgi:preprotein translocase subunit SecD